MKPTILAFAWAFDHLQNGSRAGIGRRSSGRTGEGGNMFGRFSRWGITATVAISAAVAVTFVAAPVSVAKAPPQTLNQARPQGFSCNSLGRGTICHYSFPESYGPLDTGLVCGSGAGAFDIFDQGTLNHYGTYWFDENGNLTKFTDDVNYSFGQWSNRLTGDVVPYTQHNTTTFVLAVPGDFTTAIQTLTGENIYRSSTGKTVLLNAGRTVFNYDQSQVLSTHGPNAFFAAFVEGDPHTFDQVCAALGAT
jgi:hypothetical protein